MTDTKPNALHEASLKGSGQKALVEAKMAEFEGLLLIGNRRAADKCREDFHALIDAWFDGRAEFVEHLRSGRFL